MVPPNEARIDLLDPTSRLKPILNINDIRLDWKPLYDSVSRTLSLYQKKRFMGQT
jgi:hypothetical protein